MSYLIAIEGIDGSGKGTQANLLNKKLVSYSFTSQLFSFPMYQQTFFGKEVGRYLNGNFGSLKVVHPKLAAILYAGDRFEMKGQLSTALRDNDLLICDRYVPSNVAHQSAKLPKESRESFQKWVLELEYEVFKVPKPDIVFLLNIAPDLASNLVGNKQVRSYTTKKRDLHEENLDYLMSVRETYLDLAKDSNWVTIECSQSSKLRTPEEIHENIISVLVENGIIRKSKSP